MNTYNKIWKNISRQLKYAKNSPQETDYQSAIYEIITDSDYLGWPSDRVKREYPVQMGSIKKSDIVLLDSDLSPLIAIEVKLSNSASNGIEQLGSYMDRMCIRDRSCMRKFVNFLSSEPSHFTTLVDEIPPSSNTLSGRWAAPFGVVSITSDTAKVASSEVRLAPLV